MLLDALIVIIKYVWLVILTFLFFGMIFFVPTLLLHGIHYYILEIPLVLLIYKIVILQCFVIFATIQVYRKHMEISCIDKYKQPM
jgi:hypothetical protein